MRSSVEIAEAVKLRYNEERKNGEKPDFTRIVLDEISHDLQNECCANIDTLHLADEVRTIIIVDVLRYKANHEDWRRTRSTY